MRAAMIVGLLGASLLAGCLNPEGPIDRTPEDMEGGSTNTDGSWNLTFFGVNGDPFLGDEDADVQVVAFDAPRCPNCKRYHDNVFPDIKADYIDTGRIGYHFVQFTVGYPYDITGSVAEECAHREGGTPAYVDTLDAVFAGQPGPFDEAKDELRDILRQVAADHGLDEAVLLACFDNEETRSEVDADIAAGRDSGAGSNPGFAVLGPNGFVEYVRGSAGPGDAIERALAA